MEDERKLGAVRREQAEDVAFLEPVGGESRRDALHRGAELAVGHGAAGGSVDQRGFLTERACPRQHKAMQRDVRHPHVGIRTPKNHAHLAPRSVSKTYRPVRTSSTVVAVEVRRAYVFAPSTSERLA